MRVVGLIPARSGSKRVPDKNIRELGGHPMIAYTIRSAIDSGVFDRVIVSTDSEEYAEIAKRYGAEVPFMRPAELALDNSRDIDWIRWTLEQLPGYEAFAILRPTSPFRKAETIQRAWKQFSEDGCADSLRAVQKVSEHPGKMWTIDGDRMHPLLPLGPPEAPWHSSATQGLPPVYVQNASLEIAWVKTVLDQGSIAGRSVMPFLTVDEEGIDVNTEIDWTLAELLLNQGQARLPLIS
jgi:CMP-N-acetylneuraminic acid synthetase